MDKNVLALIVTLAILGIIALLMRRGTKWLDSKQRRMASRHVPVPGFERDAVDPSRTTAGANSSSYIEVEYPSRATTGRDAVSTWEKAKSEGLGVPLIVADWPASGKWSLARKPNDILRAAEQISDPLPLLHINRPPKLWPDDVVAVHGSTVVRKYDNGQMLYLPEVQIVWLPARDSSEIPAYLDLGGWNDCPAAEKMVAALRQWQHDYGAELVAIGRDTMDIKVARRPATREEALRLARQQAKFCSDVVENPEDMIEELAATLMISDWWFFWWD